MFRCKTTGFEKIEFLHCALPENDLNQISTACSFLNKPLSFPLMISAITGGYPGALRINASLAEVCHSENIAMSVGSQRPVLSGHDQSETYRIVRRKMPGGVVLGNIGAGQVASLASIDPFLKLVDMLEADALTVHLNPLQEVLQPEGDVRFKGVLKGIEQLVRKLPVPVVVKEVGCGISDRVAKKLMDVGVKYVDVAGAGGTSWAAIEGFRGGKKHLVRAFREWGLPTAESLSRVLKYPDLHVIASGGIDSGVTMAKAVAMGAELCGSALPLFRTLMARKTKGLIQQIGEWKAEFKTVLFLTGCQNIGELRMSDVLIKQ